MSRLSYKKTFKYTRLRYNIAQKQEGIMRKISVVLAAALLAGCSNLELTSAGQQVQLVTSLTPSEASNYTYLGEVACSFGMNAKSASTNIIQCRNELRNEAALMGAGMVVIQHQQIGTQGSLVINNSFANSGCPNCISMVGSAYR